MVLCNQVEFNCFVVLLLKVRFWLTVALVRHTVLQCHEIDFRKLSCTYRVGKSVTPFLKVCNSCIWWHRKATHILNAKHIVCGKNDILNLIRVKCFCTSPLKLYCNYTQNNNLPFTCHISSPMYQVSSKSVYSIPWTVMLNCTNQAGNVHGLCSGSVHGIFSRGCPVGDCSESWLPHTWPAFNLLYYLFRIWAEDI